MKRYLALIIIISGLVIIGGKHSEAQSLKESGTLNPDAKGEIRKDGLPRYTIAVQPLILSNGGLKIDFEKRLKQSKNWLQLGLTGFYRPRYKGDHDGWENFNSDFDPLNKYNGFGVDVNFKHFFGSNFFWWSAGLGYTYHEVYYNTWGYDSYKEEGLTFYEYVEKEQRQVFNKVYPNISIGIQSSLRRLFFIDAFLGLGYAHSFYDKGKRAFDDNMFGYGFRGMRCHGGVRIGMPLGRR